MDKQELLKYLDRIPLTGPGGMDKLKKVILEIIKGGSGSGDVTEEELQEALANKQDLLVSGESIKTINNVSILGTGNIAIPKGEDGQDGAPGPAGPQGPQGPQGIQGNTGSSVDYPYELVNNRTTNDATKGLSAAEGYRMGQDISQLEAEMQNYEIESEINLLSFTEKSGFMANDTQWLIPVAQNPRTHISIPVAVGDWYQLEAQEQQGARIAFLTHDQIPTTNLETIDSVGVISIWQNATSNFQIPEGCTYLAINKTRVNANDWLPKKLYKTKPPVGLNITIDELKDSVYHLDYPPFFSQNADWDIIKTDEVRGTLVDLELVRGELPNGSYIKYMGGRSQNPGQFAFFVYDSSGNTLSSIVKVIPTDGTLSTIYSNGACSFKLVVDGSKMKMGTSSFFDWASSNLFLDNNYLRVEGTPKTIVCFGDSITQFSDSSGLSYPQYLSRLSGCNVYNAGIGGTRLARRATPTAPVTTEEMAWASVDISNLISAWINNDWTVVDSAITYLYNHGHDYRDIVAGLKLIDASTVDIVTIFGGTNDFTGNSSLGVIGSTDISNVSGALETIINLIQTENPAIEIFVFTPIVRYINNTRTDAYWSDNYESNGKKLPDVAEHIENTCKYFHINCENWYWTLGWNQFNFSEYFNDNDGTHPYKGFKYIGEKMFRYIYGKTNFSK